MAEDTMRVLRALGYTGNDATSLKDFLATPIWQEYLRQRLAEERLNIVPARRVGIYAVTSGIAGALLGISHGSSTAGLRFRAENAHRLPKSQTGWYLYHKSKNYNMALGGVKEGGKMAAKLAFWVTAFGLIERGWDDCRGEKDAVNTMLASATVATAFSAWNRFPLQTAARTAKAGLAVGFVFGLAQDAVMSMRGRRPRYVDFIVRKLAPRSTTEPSATTLTA